MFDDLMTGVRKVERMTETEKELERLKRDRNLFEKETIELKKKNNKLLEEIGYLRKRDKILTTVEAKVCMIVGRYKNSDVRPPYYDMFVKLNKQLNEERKIIDEKEIISF